jgi:hypothetical protein
VRALSSVLAALVRPDQAFRPGGMRSIRPLLLAMALFLPYVVGQRLVSGYDRNPEVQILAMAEVESRVGSLMANAPAEIRDRARTQMARALTGGGGTALASVSVVASGLGFLLVAMESWLVLSVLAQFAGGEEEPAAGARHRPSMVLVLVAFLPLALRKLAEGVVIALKDPSVAANALTLSDYRELSRVRFDLYGLLHLPSVSAFVAYLLRSLTDPFSLWFLCILIVGGTRVYRMQARKTALQASILLLLFAAQSALFNAIGVAWEI